MPKINGTFTSYWDSGDEYASPATLDTDTGEIEVHKTHDISDDLCLVDEDFVGENGKRYDVCPNCHSFILKTEMVEGVGKHLHEKQKCTSEECGYGG